MASSKQIIRLIDLAKEHLENADGNVVLANESLLYLLDNNRNVRAAIVEEAITEAVNTFVSKHNRDERRKIVSSIQPRKTDMKKAQGKLMGENSRLIMDFPLAGGIKLRDATRPAVIDQANHYSKSAKDMGHKSRWLFAVAKCLKNDEQIVGKVLSGERVLNLYAEAA
jgi:hypothetical protein